MSTKPSAGGSGQAAGRRGQFKPGSAPKGKPFVKGVSGNPKGTSKSVAEVKALALSYSAEAIETLVKHMRSKNPKVSLAASVAILDRGLGRPLQEISGTLATFNFDASAPITDAAVAARVYASMIGDPSFDISRISFASPEPYPVATLEPIEVPARRALTVDVPEPVKAVRKVLPDLAPIPPEKPDSDDDVWSRLGQ
jgi:hypothetical protein